MRVLLQRVTHAKVEVAGHEVGAIDRGLLLFVGIEKQDNATITAKMAQKIVAYRLFADAREKMNLSVKEVNGGILAVSQFTLVADTQKGLRPSFSSAAAPDWAKTLFDAFVSDLSALHSPIEQGVFAADMQISLINDGPVTFLLEM